MTLFHQLSKGVPRVQDYAVKAANGDQSKALEALKPGGKGLKEVLRAQFDYAIHKTGTPALMEAIEGALAALPPPIPPRHLAAIAGTTVDIVNDLVNDLLPGLCPTDDGILIADEDFEDFINEEAQANLSATRAKVAEYFVKHHQTDAYAATHVADALVAARLTFPV